MPVLLLAAVVFVLLICLLVVVDRTLKAVQRGRRRRDAAERLTAAAAKGEAKARQRKATEQVSAALTSVMPTIHDVDTRHVDEPGEAAAS
jgi:F0F1-type ATP synthase membrane subunit b/b'